jgi:hypothetical protein
MCLPSSGAALIDFSKINKFSKPEEAAITPVSLIDWKLRPTIYNITMSS